MGTTGRVASLVSAALLSAGLLAGCGSSDSSTVAKDPASSMSPRSTHDAGRADPTSPACTEVWKGGRTLPHVYRGCATTAGWVKAQVYQCSDGHRVVTYAHAFYAVPGRTISRAATTLAKDHGFRHTMAVCGA
jgi:hypothetical protein